MSDCIVTVKPAADPASLDGYGDVPIAFWVRSQFIVDVDGDVPPDLELVEEPVDPPYFKDYDRIPGEGPTQWRRWLDISDWAVLRAHIDRQYVGAAVVAWNTDFLDVLENRKDLAVLWDIRVSPDARRYGVGRQLFTAVEDWARMRDCTELKIETQNINVPACRFYSRMGSVLRTINLGVYPDVPHEVQFYWYKKL